MLSAQAKAINWAVFAVDWAGNRHRLHVRPVNFDLTQEDAQAVFMKWLDDIIKEFGENMVYLWAAPPSGTASRAREMRLAESDGGPPPLRSAEFPAGLPGLAGNDLAKVERANALYKFVAQVVLKYNARLAGFCIENPASSYFWDYFVLIAELELVYAILTMCNFGSSRDKKTKLATSAKIFTELEGPCSKVHDHRFVAADGSSALHAPWGRTQAGSFATTAEAAYTSEFANKVLAAIEVYLEVGSTLLAEPQLVNGHQDQTLQHKPQGAPGDGDDQRYGRRKAGLDRAERAVGTGRQPRGRFRGRAVRPYAEYWSAVVEGADVLDLRAWLRNPGRRAPTDFCLGPYLAPANSVLTKVAGYDLGALGRLQHRPRRVRSRRPVSSLRKLSLRTRAFQLSSVSHGHQLDS